MGDATDKVVALAGTTRVDGYTRRSSTGKTVHVDAYTRSPSKMSLPELNAELAEFRKSENKTDAERNRYAAVYNEVFKRERKAKSTAPKADPESSSPYRVAAQMSDDALDAAIKSGGAGNVDLKTLENEKAIRTKVRSADHGDSKPGDLNFNSGESKKTSTFKAVIGNPSTAPTADGQAAMEKKTDAQLKIFAADGGIRAADRKFAVDELARRGIKTSGAGSARESRIATQSGGAKPGGPLANWYGAQVDNKVDDFGRTQAKDMTREDLLAAITEREHLNTTSKFGDSGAVDLKILKDELKSRGTTASKNGADASVEKMMKAQTKPKGVTLADIAYDLGIPMAQVKAMVARSKYIEKRGTRFWYVDPS